MACSFSGPGSRLTSISLFPSPETGQPCPSRCSLGTSEQPSACVPVITEQSQAQVSYITEEQEINSWAVSQRGLGVIYPWSLTVLQLFSSLTLTLGPFLPYHIGISTQRQSHSWTSFDHSHWLQLFSNPFHNQTINPVLSGQPEATYLLFSEERLGTLGSWVYLREHFFSVTYHWSHTCDIINGHKLQNLKL